MALPRSGEEGFSPWSLRRGPAWADAWTPTLPPPGQAPGHHSHAIFRRFQSSFCRFSCSRTTVFSSRHQAGPPPPWAAAQGLLLADHGLTVKTKCDEFQHEVRGSRRGPSGMTLPGHCSWQLLQGPGEGLGWGLSSFHPSKGTCLGYLELRVNHSALSSQSLDCFEEQAHHFLDCHHQSAGLQSGTEPHVSVGGFCLVLRAVGDPGGGSTQSLVSPSACGKAPACSSLKHTRQLPPSCRSYCRQHQQLLELGRQHVLARGQARSLGMSRAKRQIEEDPAHCRNANSKLMVKTSLRSPQDRSLLCPSAFPTRLAPTIQEVWVLSSENGLLETQARSRHASPQGPTQ